MFQSCSLELIAGSTVETDPYAKKLETSALWLGVADDGLLYWELRGEKTGFTDACVALKKKKMENRCVYRFFKREGGKVQLLCVACATGRTRKST